MAGKFAESNSADGRSLGCCHTVCRCRLGCCHTHAGRQQSVLFVNYLLWKELQNGAISKHKWYTAVNEPYHRYRSGIDKTD